MRLTEYSHGAGCACKLSPIELGQILGALPPIIDPNVLHASASRSHAWYVIHRSPFASAMTD